MNSLQIPCRTLLVPTLGRATEEAGQRAGQLLEVIDEVAQPRSNRPPPTKFFWAQTGLDARRTRQPVGRGTNRRSPRWRAWAVEFARFSALSGVVRDNGSGLGKGLKLERARRRARRTAGSRGFAGHLSHVPRGWPCPAENLSSRPAAWSEPRRPRRSWTGRAVRENRGRATPHRQAACGVRPRDFGIRRWPPRGPGS